MRKRSRPPLREIQQALLMFAPPEGLKNPPSFMDKKAREYKKREKNKNGETPFSARLRKELKQLYGHFKVMLFRNNVGKTQDNYGNWIIYGLCNGSSDNIGWRSMTITEEMLGKRVAVFVAAEAKTNSDEAEEHQEEFLQQVREAGGIAVVINAARGEKAAIDQIMNWKPS